jgi:quercetin dioxygenase-like cupin family protein
MNDRVKPTHLRPSDLELLDVKVTRDGGAVRYLEGQRHGLVTSVFASEIVAGSGPAAHTHTYAEIFILHEGQGRYTVEGQHFDAVAGDVVIVPPEQEHEFTNIGPGVLRHTAIHESPVQAASYKDPATK